MIKPGTQSDEELISALADGQLHGEEFARAVAWVADNDEARLEWHAYHLIGDVLRSGEAMVSSRELGFAQRLQLRLQQEAPVSSVAGLTAGMMARQLAASADSSRQSDELASNDGSARWKLLAGFASLVTMGLVGWYVAGGQRDIPQLAQLQLQAGGNGVLSQQSLAVDPSGPQPMLRDPQLDALLAAHRQSGGGSALAMSAGFVRNAAFEGAAR